MQNSCCNVAKAYRMQHREFLDAVNK
eukprot:COSAG05_NODE_15255_length_374_cov_0.872727_2_plen_25_part_01